MMRRLSAQEIRSRLEELVARDLAPAVSGAPEMAVLLRAYLERPAKLLRPVLLAETARVYGARDEEAVLDLAAATELLHIFALIHDDRIDGIDRDGREIRDDADRATMRVLLGDLVHTVADGIVAVIVAEHHLNPAIIRTIRDISATTVAGQVRNMRFLRDESAITLERLFELYDQRTGYYSFVFPLRLGALSAGVVPAVDGPLDKLGLALGRAFQLTDDADDMRALSRGELHGVPDWEFNLAATYLVETRGSSSGDTVRGIDEPSFTGDAAARNTLVAELDVDALESWVHRQLEALSAEAEAALDSLDLPPDRKQPLAAFTRELFRTAVAKN
jgi:geranylgeranyl pyrophosphate synthase